MKVVCVTYDYYGPWSSFSVDKFVKIGEFYDVIENVENNYYQLNLSNGPVNLSKNYFKTISEIRQEKLNELV